MHEWHVKEATGLALRLKSIRMIPSFINIPIWSGCPKHTNVRAIVYSLQSITKMYDARYPGSNNSTDGDTPYQLWDSGHPSRLLISVLDAHIKSFSGASPSPASRRRELLSLWSGFCVAVGMYLTSILSIWNMGEPAEPRLLRHVLWILRRDLQGDLPGLAATGKEAQTLWLWKMFLGAFSLAHAQETAGEEVEPDLLAYFSGNIRAWSEVTGTTHWQEVRKRLTEIVWPSNFASEELAESLWNRSIHASEDEE